MGPLIWLERLPRASTAALMVAWIFAVGVLDYHTGYQISVGALYLVGIAWGSWCCGRVMGLSFVLLATGAWFLAESLSRPDGYESVLVFWNSFMRFCYFLPVMLLIVSLRERSIREERSSRTDPLTGTYNSHAFLEQLDLEIALAGSQRHGPFTLVYMDLDDFKLINSAIGHEGGDRFLQEVATLMAIHTRPVDVIGRLGGDEFAVLMPRTDGRQAQVLIARLVQGLSSSMQEKHPPATFSIGVASFGQLPAKAEDALRFADSLMYEAKRNGKNQICYGSL